MTSAGAFTQVDVTTIAGNRITMQGHTCTTAVSAATVAAAVMADKEVDVTLIGDVHGFLRFPFADPDTLEGALTPAELKTSQIKLTQGAAGGTTGLLVEEIFGY
jgi:hypothetical protein